MAKRKNKELREVSELKKQSAKMHLDVDAMVTDIAREAADEVRASLRKMRTADKYFGVDTLRISGRELRLGHRIVTKIDKSGKVTATTTVRQLEGPHSPMEGCHNVHVNNNSCYEANLPLIDVLA